MVQAVYDAYKQKYAEALLDKFDTAAESSQTDLMPWGGRFRGISG